MRRFARLAATACLATATLASASGCLTANAYVGPKVILIFEAFALDPSEEDDTRPLRKALTVKIDAIDSFGNHGQYEEQPAAGMPPRRGTYPFNELKSSPYAHEVRLPDNTVTISFSATAQGLPGEGLTCYAVRDGRELFESRETVLFPERGGLAEKTAQCFIAATA